MFFRDIFSAIQYVNSRYEGGATSSDNNTTPIQLFPMMLEPRNIFVKMANGKARVMLGNFKTKLSDVYVSRSSRGARRGNNSHSFEIISSLAICIHPSLFYLQIFKSFFCKKLVITNDYYSYCLDY